MNAPSRKPGEDDSFVLSALHRHLKEQLTSATGGQRELLLHLLGVLDGLSDGRYPSGFGGVQ